jgi:hypothetical protein
VARVTARSRFTITPLVLLLLMLLLLYCCIGAAGMLWTLALSQAPTTLPRHLKFQHT